MSQEDLQKEDGDDALRRFIDRLENWPEDEPPTPAELRELRREIRLTQDERDKLEILSENHIRRARASVDAGAYDQAAAELARAAQLRPLDPRPKTELAGIYLQRSLERGYRRNDRAKAIRLARKALELNPGDPEAQLFLREYRRMNADFRNARYRRYILPVLGLIIIMLTLAVWQREWIVDFVTPSPQDAPRVSASPVPDLVDGASRPVPVETPGLADGSVEAEVLQAILGRRNDSSFVDVTGRIHSRSATLSELRLLLRGRDEEGAVIFSLPVTVRDEAAPLLRPGDSQSLRVFRWLPDDESSVSRLDLEVLDIGLLGDDVPYLPSSPELVWNVPRPEGVALETEARDIRTYEAFDRQVVLMDLAITNTGVPPLSELSVDISLGSEYASLPYRTIGIEEAPLERGERRVWPVAIGFPLDADLERRPVTIRVTEVSR